MLNIQIDPQVTTLLSAPVICIPRYAHAHSLAFRFRSQAESTTHTNLGFTPSELSYLKLHVCFTG